MNVKCRQGNRTTRFDNVLKLIQALRCDSRPCVLDRSEGEESNIWILSLQVALRWVVSHLGNLLPCASDRLNQEVDTTQMVSTDFHTNA